MEKNTLIRAAIAATALMGSLPTAIADEAGVAYVARVTGAALVNKGDQYVDGTEGMALSTGDRVMTLAQSEAAIQFNDGCQYLMKENELITIPSKSPCVFTKGAADRLSVVTLPPVPAVLPLVPAAAGIGLGWVPLAAGAALLPAVFSDPGDDIPPPVPISQ